MENETIIIIIAIVALILGSITILAQRKTINWLYLESAELRRKKNFMLDRNRRLIRMIKEKKERESKRLSIYPIMNHKQKIAQLKK